MLALDFVLSSCYSLLYRACVFAVLTWSMYFLASHPEVQQKLHDELVSVLGKETVTFEAVDQLP